jgi:hypothetical protein
MLMATLSQELTSSIRQLKRTQQQQQQQAGSSSSSYAHLVSAGGSADMAGAGGLMASSSRASLDAGYELMSSSSSGGNATAAAALAVSAQFVPRLQLVEHNSGPIRVLHSSRQDVLLLHINLQQLLQQLEAHTRQQQRTSSRQRQQQQQHAGSRGSVSIDGESWLPSGVISRPGSLDLGSLHGGMESVGVSPHAYAAAAGGGASLITTAAAAAGASDAGLSRQGSGHSSHSQLSAVAEAFLRAAVHMGGSQAPQQQQQRRQLAPAVALALQALCVLHRWGCDSALDDQLAAMLLGAGLGAALPLVLPQQQQQQGAALASAGLSARPSLDDYHAAAAAAGAVHSGRSRCRGMSPSGPEHEAVGASVLSGAPASPAASVNQQHLYQQQHSLGSSSGEVQHEQQLLLHQLAQLLQDASHSGPQLLRCCPCLSQEVLLSGNGAMVLALPAARPAAAAGMQQQPQQQQQAAPPGVLLRAAPSLLSCR